MKESEEQQSVVIDKRKRILRSIADCAEEKGRIPNGRDYNSCECREVTASNVRNYFKDWNEVLVQSPVPAVGKKSTEIVREHRYEEYKHDQENSRSDA